MHLNVLQRKVMQTVEKPGLSIKTISQCAGFFECFDMSDLIKQLNQDDVNAEVEPLTAITVAIPEPASILSQRLILNQKLNLPANRIKNPHIGDIPRFAQFKFN